jgi:hypothetical protein
VIVPKLVKAWLNGCDVHSGLELRAVEIVLSSLGMGLENECLFPNFHTVFSVPSGTKLSATILVQSEMTRLQFCQYMGIFELACHMGWANFYYKINFTNMRWTLRGVFLRGETNEEQFACLAMCKWTVKE